MDNYKVTFLTDFISSLVGYDDKDFAFMIACDFSFLIKDDSAFPAFYESVQSIESQNKLSEVLSCLKHAFFAGNTEQERHKMFKYATPSYSPNEESQPGAIVEIIHAFEALNSQQIDSAIEVISNKLSAIPPLTPFSDYGYEVIFMRNLISQRKNRIMDFIRNSE